MRFIIKLLIVIAIILLCSGIGRRRPELAGLIAVMPLTGLLAMLWLYSDHAGDLVIMRRYTLGAVWGIIPSILFFAAAYLGFRRGWHLSAVLGIGFGAWLTTALLHQYLLAQD